MSTKISTRAGDASKNAVDRADITVELFRTAEGSEAAGSGLVPIGIAKTFSFNVSKPKTPIHVLSQLPAAGFAREPEDKTFSMTELATFEQIEHQGFFMSSADPFTIQITHSSETDTDGNPLATADQKIIRLTGVEFETSDYNVDANTSEYVWNFTGRFTRGEISGDLNADIPITGGGAVHTF